MNTTMTKIRAIGLVQFTWRLLAWTLLAGAAGAQSSMPSIVVLPFFTEEGVEVRGGGNGFEGRHQWRLWQSIGKHLRESGLKVIDPSDIKLTPAQYVSLRGASHENLPAPSSDLAPDIIYRMWFDVSTDMISNDHCRASVRIKDVHIKDEGGHDSAMWNTPIKADIAGSSFRATRRDCEEAIIEAETDAGYEIGQIVLAQLDRRSHCIPGTNVTPGADLILRGPHTEESVGDDCVAPS
ncbi:MAG: hypothetical protein OXU81_09810 [Gammaproteobacteria bacterium]|nr:hypothetical protein [Gammaproteobacteria bacterium]